MWLEHCLPHHSRTLLFYRFYKEHKAFEIMFIMHGIVELFKVLGLHNSLSHLLSYSITSLKIPQEQILSLWKLHYDEWFVLSSPCRLRHCVTQSTEIHSWIAQMGWGFPQVEGRFVLLKFSLKAFNALNQRFSWEVLEEKLGALAGVLDIPEERRSRSIDILAPQLQWSSFRDTDVVVRLAHWLGSGIFCKAMFY